MIRSTLLNSLLVLSLIGSLAIVSGCDATSPSSNGSQLTVDQEADRADTHRMVPFSTAEVLSFETMEQFGKSLLFRRDGSVSFRLKTTGLEPGTVHTLWIVIFNNPENCSEPGCAVEDLFNAEANPDLAYADGAVIGETGRALFEGQRAEGDNTGSIMEEWFGLPEPGLVDADAAEIHFVVHSHGPIIPGLVEEMRTTFNAGCGPEFEEGLPPVPESLGTYGPNTCVDVQFAVHAPDAG